MQLEPAAEFTYVVKLATVPFVAYSALCSHQSKERVRASRCSDKVASCMRSNSLSCSSSPASAVNASRGFTLGLGGLVCGIVSPARWLVLVAQSRCQFYVLWQSHTTGQLSVVTIASRSSAQHANVLCWPRAQRCLGRVHRSVAVSAGPHFLSSEHAATLSGCRIVLTRSAMSRELHFRRTPHGLC